MTRSYLGYVSSQTTDSVPLMSYGVATGGSSSSITVSGQAYTLLTFSSDDNLVVTRDGLFDVLLVGGGGGAGAGGQTYANAGGGAGALVGYAETLTIYLAAGTHAVDVGAGGAISFSNVGGASYIGSMVSAACGGSGGNGQDYLAAGEASRAFNMRGTSGGSGGGNIGYASTLFVGKSVDQTFGNDGGYGSSRYGGGGGGGYGSAGGNASGGTGGAGGDGQDISSWIGAGSATYVCAGGGGGGNSAGGAAGLGGVAGVTSATGVDATTNGSGGAGGYNGATAGAGAAGKVWVRFKV